jgi:hypothetical protein
MPGREKLQEKPNSLKTEVPSHNILTLILEK